MVISAVECGLISVDGPVSPAFMERASEEPLPPCWHGNILCRLEINLEEFALEVREGVKCSNYRLEGVGPRTLNYIFAISL